MRKFSRNEKIAATLGVITIFAFLPALSSLVFSSSDVSPGLERAARSVTGIRQALKDVSVEDLVIGNGTAAKQGDRLYLHYVGQLEDGTTFDTSVTSPVPFAVTLGAGQLITGWELGLEGMRAGGTRRLVVPPALGYGDSEIMDVDGGVLIPANATLVFDVVLLRVDRPFE